MTAPTASPASPGNLRRIVLIVALLTASAPLSIDMYLPAFPLLQAEFSASASQIQGTLGAFLGGLAVGQLFYGPLSDRLGRRGPLLAGVALFIAASLAIPFVHQTEDLLILRLVQALGGCAGMVIGRAVLADCFQGHEAAKAFAMVMLVMGVAPIAAPALGGQLLALGGWQLIFWSLAAFGALCLLAVALTLPETLSHDRRTQGGAGQVLIGMGKVLGNLPFMGITLCGALTFAGMFAYISASPFLFITLFHITPETYSLLFGVNAAGLIVASQFNMLLLRHFSAMRVMTVCLAVSIASALALVGLGLAAVESLPVVMAPMFVIMAANGLILPNGAAMAMGMARDRAGAASAIMGVTQFALGAVASMGLGLAGETSVTALGVLLLCTTGSALACLRLPQRGDARRS